MNALQRLPLSEQHRLLSLANAHHLPTGDLSCFMTRQKGYGSGRTRRGREYDISYDLMLCEYCGNLEPSSVCPAKVQKIRTFVTEDLVGAFTRSFGYLFDRNKVARIAERFRSLEDNGLSQDAALALASFSEFEWATEALLAARQVKGLLTA
jgi:hypothetical protein